MMTTETVPAPQVRLLAPASGAQPLASLLAGLGEPGEPFSAARRQTLVRLSRAVLRDAGLRADAASVALGYWLRRANVDRLAQGFERRREAAPDTVFVPVGRVFHVAPGNVDTVFVYSWALSYLCGNQNVVRVSAQPSDILGRLLGVLSSLMADDAELAGANRFVTYEHDQATSEALSRWATHRVVWGGDDTVARFRAMPLGAHASERAFGSKFSYSVLGTAAYLAASEQTVDRLAAGFFNDIFWFDQMACSSPHLLFWLGPPDPMDAALDRFHGALEREIEWRGYHGAPSSAMHRLSFVVDLACETELRAELGHEEFLAVRLPDGAVWRKESCGAGLFTHVRADDLSQVAAFAAPQDQTITHFGLSPAELRTLARRAGARGVDRLVPVGEALAFDATWDGYDLVGDFLRRVTVRIGAQE
ncbi:MAG TPA: acyl-CoA reductase [Longimicrobiales bacterium]|nr:acyl-CoA reductase [Longimicrobiales bacterium]